MFAECRCYVVFAVTYIAISLISASGGWAAPYSCLGVGCVEVRWTEKAATKSIIDSITHVITKLRSGSNAIRRGQPEPFACSPTRTTTALDAIHQRPRSVKTKNAGAETGTSAITTRPLPVIPRVCRLAIASLRMKSRSIDHWVRARTKSHAVRRGLDPPASYSLVQAFADFSEHRRGEVREIFPAIVL